MHQVVVLRKFCTLVVLMASWSSPPSFFGHPDQHFLINQKAFRTIGKDIPSTTNKMHCGFDTDVGSEPGKKITPWLQHTPHFQKHSLKMLQTFCEMQNCATDYQIKFFISKGSLSTLDT